MSNTGNYGLDYSNNDKWSQHLTEIGYYNSYPLSIYSIYHSNYQSTHIIIINIITLLHIHLISSGTNNYRGLFINKCSSTYSDLLIYNIHSIDIRTLINDTRKQQLTWKPIWEKPQRFSSFGMRNILLAPFVCALILQTLF